MGKGAVKGGDLRLKHNRDIIKKTQRSDERAYKKEKKLTLKYLRSKPNGIHFHKNVRCFKDFGEFDMNKIYNSYQTLTYQNRVYDTSSEEFLQLPVNLNDVMVYNRITRKTGIGNIENGAFVGNWI